MYQREIYHNPENVTTGINIDALAAKTAFPDGELNLAVSGGADSAAMVALAAHMGRDAVIHHVNHGLRDNGDTEEQRVRSLGERFGYQVVIHHAIIEGDSNIEEKARNERRRLMPSNMMTGHTANDRAETFLHNLMRGAGSNGLAVMVNKPLVGLTETEIDQICVYFNLDLNVDETNFTDTYTRNRTRHELIPLMSDIAGRDVIGPINRTSDILAEESAFLDQIASNIDVTDCKTARTQPDVLLRRATKTWLETNVSRTNISLKNVELVIEVIKGNTGGAQVCGKNIRRTNNILYVRETV